jgi:hypothetical protein
MDYRFFHHQAPQILSLICCSYFGVLGCELSNAVDGGRSKIRHINTPLQPKAPPFAGIPSQIGYGGYRKIRHGLLFLR